MLAPVLIVLAGCTRNPTSRLASADSTPVIKDSTHSARAQVTDHYIKLLRTKLNAADPYRAQVAINCEALRVLRVITDTSRDKLAGENEASRLLQIAAREAYTPADVPARKRVDSVLAGRVFEADDHCEALARAGVLGDTVWPRFKKWKE